MKLNIENKAKFFNQYRGKKVFKLEGLDRVYYAPYDDTLEDDHLLLKSLSSMTDKEAIEISSIIGIDNDAMVHHGRLFVDRILGKRSGNSQDNCYLTYTSLWACDYLKSKGYALPWMGNSVDDMIKAGWIKLKS